MRPFHWCVTFVTGFAVASTSVVLAQGQVPPSGGRLPVGGTAQPAQPVAQPQAAAPRGTTVAVIDVKYVFENYLKFKTAMEQIKKDYDAFEAHVRNVETTLKGQIEQLKSLQPGSPEFKQLETDVATKRTQVQLDINNKQKERVEDEAQVYHRAYQELESEIARFATRYGIDLVLQYSSADIDPTKPDTVIRGLNRMVVYQNQLNITANILAELNRNAPTQTAPVNQPPQRNALGPSIPGGVPKSQFPKTR